MLSDRQLLRAAEDIRFELIQKFPQWAETVRGTNIRIWGMSACAGRACKRLNWIKLSRSYFSSDSNFLTDFRDTTLHEFAHILAPYGSHHNSEWRAIARTIGAKPERCHSMQLAEGFSRRRKRYLNVKCGCGISRIPAKHYQICMMKREYFTQHNAGYLCRNCKQWMEYISTELA